MRGAGTFVLTLGLVVVLAAPAAAQQRQRGQRGQRGQGGGMGGFAALLDNEAVQKELKVEKDQVDKAKAAAQKVREKHKEQLDKIRDLGQDERRDLMRTVADETLQSLGEILKPEQLKRLKQIELQQVGAQAFTRADVQKALTLTADQQEKIKTISDDSAKSMRELFQGGNAQGGREKIAALRKETGEKIQAVLTDDQKKAWKELTGEPFEVRLGQRRRGGDR